MHGFESHQLRFLLIYVIFEQSYEFTLLNINSRGIMLKKNTAYFEDFITRHIHNSNAIEGNTLSFYDTYAIVFNDNAIIRARPRELYEVINLKYALDFVLAESNSELSIDMIKQIGVIINKGVKDISGFRQVPVRICGASHIPPNADDVPRLISDLVNNCQRSNYNSVFEYLADFHINFEYTHPFVDGNGRTGRLILTKQALQSGLAPLVIPVDLRDRYISMIDKKDVSGLASMFEELEEYERKRISEFGVVL